ncbi:N-6 DNA methylase [Actinomyces slackii]|uniref:Modification methylase Eco57IB n=1 Tax=Actinomyces slackii TaxID=52774 RepID=A0A3S4TDS9_9ACTO|nr:N-6 DNA methylase [Actinomyces slackii]VEG75616.1 Modification methylase Eco57IB [Actinomyces slackii]
MQTYVDSRESRKERGAFFTPPSVAEFIAGWAIRRDSDSVLEPSCGEAVFLTAAARRLAELGGVPSAGQLNGVDLHHASVDRAADALRAQGFEAALSVGDFFDYRQAAVDAVIGNPPYVRYHGFTGRSRVKGAEAALSAGVRLTALASSWAAFTVVAATHLVAGGRLGLVLPAELLSVNYASEVRSYLLRSFTRVRLVLFASRVFPDVQEEVVLLLADGYAPGGSGSESFEVMQVENLDDLATSRTVSTWTPPVPGGKWTPALVDCSAYQETLDSRGFARLASWGRLTLGAVTGANKFFALSPQRVAELGLTEADVIALSPPGSRHLRRFSLKEADLDALGQAGAQTFLFSPPERPSPAGAAYIRAGELAGVCEAYKCRVRSPWWRVPRPPIADLLITYMNADSVALCANEARSAHLNSVHGLVLSSDAEGIPPVLLALAAHNSVTALGAEFIGRAYGGGLLKLEPREARDLPVPTLEAVRHAARPLERALPQILELIDHGDAESARGVVDEALGIESWIGAPAMKEIRQTRRYLAARRAARGKGVRGVPSH